MLKTQPELRLVPPAAHLKEENSSPAQEGTEWVDSGPTVNRVFSFDGDMVATLQWYEDRLVPRAWKIDRAQHDPQGYAPAQFQHYRGFYKSQDGVCINAVFFGNNDADTYKLHAIAQPATDSAEKWPCHSQ